MNEKARQIRALLLPGNNKNINSKFDLYFSSEKLIYWIIRTLYQSGNCIFPSLFFDIISLI